MRRGIQPVRHWRQPMPCYRVSWKTPFAPFARLATTLAAAGSPAAIAYVGSRTLKEFALNDLIVPVPMTDDEKAAYYPNIVETVTFDDNQWGVPIAFSTKALYWNKDLFKEAGLDPEKPPTTWA